MKNLIKFKIITIAITLVYCFITPSYADSTKINSFSPTPEGKYNSIRLLPRSSKPDPCLDGTTFVDNGFNLNLCVNDTAIGPDTYWSKNSNTIHPHSSLLSSGQTPYVGLETVTPSTQLDIKHNSSTVPIADKKYGGIFLERDGANFTGITSSLIDNNTKAGILMSNDPNGGDSVSFLTYKSGENGMEPKLKIQTPDRFCLRDTCAHTSFPSAIEIYKPTGPVNMLLQNSTLTDPANPNFSSGFYFGVGSVGNSEFRNHELQPINFSTGGKNVLSADIVNQNIQLYNATNSNGSKLAVDGPISIASFLSSPYGTILESANGYPLEIRPSGIDKGIEIQKSTTSKRGYVWTENSSTAKTGLFIDHESNNVSTPMITINASGVGFKDTQPTPVVSGRKVLDIDGVLEYTGQLCHITDGCLTKQKKSYTLKFSCPSSSVCDGGSNNLLEADFTGGPVPTCTASFKGSQELAYIHSTTQTHVRAYNGTPLTREVMILCVQ